MDKMSVYNHAAEVIIEIIFKIYRLVNVRYAILVVMHVRMDQPIINAHNVIIQKLILLMEKLLI